MSTEQQPERFDDDPPDLAGLLAEANNVIGGLVAFVEVHGGDDAEAELRRVAAYRDRLHRELARPRVRKGGGHE